MEYARLVLYAIGLIFSLALAGRLFAIHTWVARLFGTIMVGWAMGSAIFLALLAWSMITGDPDPTWRGIVMTVEAVILGVLPPIAYFLFIRPPGKSGSGGDG